MKKVLIITYYWPPSGGSGVQRWLKFTKYLPEFGWQPLVFTPENPSFEVRDHSLEKDISPELEIIKLPIWEPYAFLEKFKGKGSQQSDLVRKKKKTLFNKVLLWARGNLFIPDPRVFWVRPAVRVLEDIIQANGIDVIITTGPPHSMHLIGLRLKKKLGIKWVADFRDPWSRWKLFDSFYLSVFARKWHKKLEKSVLRNANVVIAASPHYARELESIGSRCVEVITNGFDDQELSKKIEINRPEDFIIRHVGVIDELRDPRSFFQAIKMLANEGHLVRVEFIGNVNLALQSEVRSDQVLRELVTFKKYIPHEKVFEVYQESAVLLLIPFQNMPGNIPGKLFEYMTSQSPVLFIGAPEGDAADIIREVGAGVVCDNNDVKSIKAAIERLHQQFETGEALGERSISRFSRKNLTKVLVNLLNSL